MSIFPEEQLDSPAGYFFAHPGQTLKDGQWTIARKLGWGPRSSTWLALDKNASILSYDAIKIFTVAATEDSTGNNERNLLLNTVKNIARGIPEARSHFYEHDTKGKRHLCLVFHVYGSSVEDLRLTNIYDGEYLPLYTTRKIVGDISERLADLSVHKIIHGGRHSRLLYCSLALIYFTPLQLLPRIISSSRASKLVTLFGKYWGSPRSRERRTSWEAMVSHTPQSSLSLLDTALLGIVQKII